MTILKIILHMFFERDNSENLFASVQRTVETLSSSESLNSKANIAMIFLLSIDLK